MEEIDPQAMPAGEPQAQQFTDDAAPNPDERNGRWRHLVKYCMELYERIAGSQYRAAKIQEIRDTYSRYEQEERQTSDPWPGASNIQLPLTSISVDNLEPRIVAGLIGKKPFVKFELESEQKKDEGQQLIEDWFNNELEEVVGLERVGRDIAHSLLLEGTVYPIAVYDTESRKIREFATVEDAQQMPELMQGLQPAPQVDPATGQPLVDSMTGQMMLQQPRFADIGGVLVDQATGEPVVVEMADGSCHDEQAPHWSQRFLTFRNSHWNIRFATNQLVL